MVITVVIIIKLLVILLFDGIRRLFHVMGTSQMVPDDYMKTVITGGKIEEKYLAAGRYETVSKETLAPKEWGKYVIYYPKELEQSDKCYPAVIFVNGTGVYASRYPALFEHLASWGFIVLGNEDSGTCTGASADALLKYILNENENPESIFAGKVDKGNIGISGHSQGAVGMFNAITIQEHKDFYKCAVSLSLTEEKIALALHMPYDSSKTAIPVMILAGTKNDVISLQGMQELYDKISAPKIIARKSGKRHGEMLYCADGYVTAWFMWHLQGEEEAAKAFVGTEAELINNELYQDQRSSMMMKYV